MKYNNLSLILFFLAFILFVAEKPVSSQSVNKSVTIPSEIIRDKIRGGMLGQMLGNLNGLPHEMRYLDEPGDVRNYIPSLPEGAWTDDDTDFEWVYICMMQKYRNAFLPADTIYNLWKERINKRIWCSNRYARYMMDIGFKPPFTGYITLNPWAEFNLSGQFLCETFGIIAPAMPQTAAKIGLNYTTVAIDHEPAQTTQLFTTMIATAYIEGDINKIIDAGLLALDPKSEMVNIINDIRNWHKQYPDNWKETRRLLKEKYSLESGGIRDRNGSELNTGAIIAGLLYGNGDFSETFKNTVNMGWDADCNAATACTIMGVIKGYRWMMSQGWQIVDRYKNVTRENMPMDETITSYCDRLIALFEMINQNNGGSKTIVNNVEVYQIPMEKPAPVIQLTSIEQQKKQLQNELEPAIIKSLQNGTREEKARAVYSAVCLDMAVSLSAKYPKQWEAACFDLSGYWKLMNNIIVGQYNDHFVGLNALKAKFMAAGFKAPRILYEDEGLYNDTVSWKDPKEIY